MVAYGQARSGFVQAVATVAAFIAAFWAAWAASRAAVYAKEAADHTKSGADEAKRSADASHAANELTREGLYLDHRAWMELIQIDIEEPGLKWKPGEGRINFTVRAKNVGRTPAQDVYLSLRLHIDFSIWPTVVRDEMIKADADNTGGFGQLVVADGSFVQSHNIPISDADIAAYVANMNREFGPQPVRDDKFFTSLIGVITYRPMGSRETRHTAFIFKLKQLGDPRGEVLIRGQDLPPNRIEIQRSPLGDMVAT